MILYPCFFPPGQIVFPQKTSRSPKINARYCINTSDFEPQFLHLQISLKNLVALTNLSEIIQIPEVLSTVREKWLLLHSSLLLRPFDDAQTFQQTISLSALDKVASCKTVS